jgi:iron complex outermembrane receptor protein
MGIGDWRTRGPAGGVKRGAIAAAALLVLLSPAAAQESGQEGEYDGEYELLIIDDEGLTITAPAPPPPVPAAPVNTPYGQHNEVGGEQIAAQGSMDLLDTLRDVPGVVTSKQNMIGTTTGTSLYIRGRGYDHPSLGITTAFDGVPRYGLIYGQSMADGFPVFATESIEVYKSPQPSSFGAGYGMVNLTPRYMSEQGWEARSGLNYGSFGTLSENVSFGLRRKRFDLFAAQSWISTDGHVVHSKAHQQSYYLNTGLWINAYWNLRILGNFVDAKTEKPPFAGQSRTDILPSYTTGTILTTGTLNNEYDRAEGFVKLYYNNTVFKILDEEAKIPGDWSRQLLNAAGLKARETWRLWEGGEIISGIDVDFARMVNEDHNTTQAGRITEFPDMFLYAPYGAVSHFFLIKDQFRVIPQAGLRGYLHTLWAHRAAPQAGLELGYGDTNLFFNYALGVIYPSPGTIQTLIDSGKYDSGELKKSRPETSRHYEITIRQDFRNFKTEEGSAEGSIGGTWFFDDGRDRIIPTSAAPGNISAAAFFRIQGLELNGNFNIEKNAAWLERFSLFAGGTWIYAIAARGEDGHTVDRLPYTPVFSMSAGFEWTPFKGLTLSGDYQFIYDLYGAGGGGNSAVFTDLTESLKLSDQHLLNLRLGYKFACQKIRLETCEVFVSANNILNRRYEYYAGYQMPGITFMAGAGLKFK